VAMAVLVIGATVILFRQSQEHKALVKSLVDPFIEDAKDQLDALIANTKKEAQAGPAEDRKKQLERQLAFLAKARKDLERRHLAMRVGEALGVRSPLLEAEENPLVAALQRVAQERRETPAGPAPLKKED